MISLLFRKFLVILYCTIITLLYFIFLLIKCLKFIFINLLNHFYGFYSLLLFIKVNIFIKFSFALMRTPFMKTIFQETQFNLKVNFGYFLIFNYFNFVNYLERLKYLSKLFHFFLKIEKSSGWGQFCFN